jgi:hypothetical protein
MAGVAVNGVQELRQLTSNRALLESIAKESGGRVLTPADLTHDVLFARAGVIPQEIWNALTTALLIASVAAFLLDLATRRIAWDRIFEPELAANRPAAAEHAARTLDRLKAVEAINPSQSGLELNERDARILAKKNSDRRRDERLVHYKASADPSPPLVETKVAGDVTQGESSPPTPPSQDTDSGLLAAKRRAARRFEEE